MPFLLFTRDHRGYETTSLVHTQRRQGRARQRILYFFRTPPGVKVGRPALDEEAIRWIEEKNPDIEFDWQKILEAKAPVVPSAEDFRSRRGRRDKPERRSPASQEPPVTVVAPAAEPALLPFAVADGDVEADSDADAVEAKAVEALEQLTHPDAEEKVELPALPVEQATGREELVRLRARYAEMQARITERGGDAERVQALRAHTELLNPDGWVTPEEVRRGLEEFESRIRGLRAALGLRRRRRSRRSAGSPAGKTGDE